MGKQGLFLEPGCEAHRYDLREHSPPCRFNEAHWSLPEADVDTVPSRLNSDNRPLNRRRFSQWVFLAEQNPSANTMTHVSGVTM